MSPLQKILRYSLSIGLLIALVLVLLIPSLLPNARAQAPALQKIESDDPAVSQEGTWLSQPAPSASGESYLYNSGEAALSLNFAGPSLEIWYVSGPNLGTLAIEIDDTVLRTVITTDSEVHYQQSARIDYLSDETHTLRVYAQAGGAIGVDAFVTHLAVLPNSAEPAVEAVANPHSIPPCNVPAFVRLMSVTITGGPGQGQAIFPDMSANGQWVVFLSSMQNLVSGPPEYNRGAATFYRLNTFTCVIDVVAFSGRNYYASISDDGRYVLFDSYEHLDPADTNSTADIYLRDMQTGAFILISRGVNGLSDGNSTPLDLSGDGRFILFLSSATNLGCPLASLIPPRVGIQ